jgi:hypothetical protein
VSFESFLALEIKGEGGGGSHYNVSKAIEISSTYTTYSLSLSLHVLVQKEKSLGTFLYLLHNCWRSVLHESYNSP